MHFPKTILCTILLFATILVLLFLKLGHYGERDREEYHTLVKAKEEGVVGSFTSQQLREGLKKHLFWMKDNQRLGLSIYSDQARLVFERELGKTRISEQMDQVKCCIQQELFYLLPDGREGILEEENKIRVKEPKGYNWIPMDSLHLVPVQKLLLLDAENAQYYYQEGLVVVKNALITLMVAFGHNLEGDHQLMHLLAKGNAGEARFAFNGTTLNLSEHVELEHALGKLSADQILLSAPTPKAKMHYDQMHMLNNVLLVFKNGGQLTCSEATLQYANLQGIFDGTPPNKLVTYREGDGENLLEIKSRHMEILGKTSPHIDEGDLDKAIHKIHAREDVSINYRNAFVATSQEAIYLRHPDLKAQENSLSGVITLYSSDKQRCQLSNPEKETITAKEMSIDMLKKELLFVEPRGSLHALQNKEKHEVQFSADSLTWKEEPGILTLNGNVEILEPGVGTLKTLQADLHQKRDERNRRVLKSIIATGETNLTYLNKLRDLSHTMSCQGSMIVDHEKQEVRLYSLHAGQKQVPQERQICFQDARGEVYADKMLMKYDSEDDTMTPTKVILAGNVRIFNRLALSQEDPTAVPQYVLADRVEFFPRTREMIFKSLPGRRVLFFDSVNALEISAPSLKIIRDKATKKESIKGFGDVRFHFVEKEFEDLKEKFSFDKALGKKNL